MENIYLINKNQVKHLPEHEYKKHQIKKQQCPIIPLDGLMKERQLSEYSKEAQHIIELISTQDNLLPVGSSKFKVHKYPSDIDMFEPINECCTINNVREDIRQSIQAIIRRVDQEKDILFSKFQAGYDRRYDIYLGEEFEGKLIDYNARIARREIDNLNDQGLLDEEQYAKAVSLIKTKPTLKEFKNLYYFIRSFMALEWTPKEILRGYKQLAANKKYYLDDALIDKSLIKLDLLAKLPYEDLKNTKWSNYKRYVEVTNWFLVQVTNPAGEVETLSIVQEDRKVSLSKDIVKYLSETYYDPLKAAKRYWTYLVEFKSSNKKEMQKLAPIFSSYISFLNLIATDLQTNQNISNMDMLINITTLRLKEHAPRCSFDATFNKKIINMLNSPHVKLSAVLKMIKDEITYLADKYIKEHNISFEL